METYREERTESVLLLVSLLERQRESRRPEVYAPAIKKVRRELLGLYQRIMNTRHLVDNHTKLEESAL